MATHLSFAGITSDIGGRVPPTKVTCSVTISLQGNHDLPYSHRNICCSSDGSGAAFRQGRGELPGFNHQHIDAICWEVNLLVCHSERPDGFSLHPDM